VGTARRRRFGILRYFVVVACLASATVMCRTVFAGGEKTSVVLIGTLHGYHDKATAYSTIDLRDMIIELDPAAILCELPQTMDGYPTTTDGRINPNFKGNESIAANQAADSLHVPTLPYDRDRREEIRRETRYYERRKYAFLRLTEWSGQSDGDSAAAVCTFALGCVDNVQNAQMELALLAGPQVVNSGAFDQLSKCTQDLTCRLIPELLVGADLDTVVTDLEFISAEWKTRNSAMADNIGKIAEGYSGRRIVVLCGAEHRYILKELLLGRDGIVVEEYYDVE
jgi:hypothetical protein